ncbi:cytochrome P450 9e2-like [Fopius arisanus]|uniref:Cytochrome P450 9e2-like n=3 Tax=Fopius arisanus TaxID=64838 RepID=A0A9R1TD95_9HYME|nr:PREDICTED: cytochrome P450 9e2-like [Fopius arisanus]
MEYLGIYLALVGVLCAVYYTFRRKSFFEKNGIIHDGGYPLVGNMSPVLLGRISFSEMFRKMYDIDEEAKYVGFYDLFRIPVTVIRDIDLIKSIGVKNFDHFVDRTTIVDPEQEPLFGNNLAGLKGDKWREMRNLLSPAFTSSKMKGMFKLMSDCAENFVAHIVEKTSSTPVTYNTKDLFCRYTTDVIATCAFGIAVDSMKNPTNEFYLLGKQMSIFQKSALVKMQLSRMFPRLTKALGIKVFDPKVDEFFMELVQGTIDARDKEGIIRPDMIQLMMETRNNKEGPVLGIRDMVSQAFVFFFGGFETTSSAMCFVAHHIALDPNVQRKLQQEINETLELCDQKITYDAINGMKYLDALVNECFRMHPIGVAIDRICTKEFELPPALPGKNPVLLKPGDRIWIPVAALHMSPKYWTDPETFNPERFIEDPKLLHSPAFYPFGTGPRMCIGNRFALLEMKVLIFYLVLKCNLTIGEKMILPLQLDTKSLAMTAKGGFWVSMEPRNI